ncbi:VOC family protein [Cryobacterium psychrophilum]|uniref:VOC family protein n=1 Tax=Cryobacterium psychrophilum TaxID=41988 RepID=A0A4Y8KVC6_9MICO|nr:VOC family protein [Cryobacterium psychrophilum]TDW29319.1 glyoxylase I family protein [Cryobacterium psychrophilum]TFD79993.1 VOC family protein [Cryobacterium psychrophilum]
MRINGVHHIAIIASDYEVSKRFYQEVLGCRLDAEYYRGERESWMGKLSLNGTYLIELFTFPNTPPRRTGPESLGLRHLAFEVDDVPAAREELLGKHVECEELRVDPNTHKAMFFFRDPDGLPLEIYEH